MLDYAGGSSTRCGAASFVVHFRPDSFTTRLARWSSTQTHRFGRRSRTSSRRSPARAPRTRRSSCFGARAFGFRLDFVPTIRSFDRSPHRRLCARCTIHDTLAPTHSDGAAIAELLTVGGQSENANAVTGLLVSRTLIPVTSPGIATRKISNCWKATVEDTSCLEPLPLERAPPSYKDGRCVGGAADTCVCTTRRDAAGWSHGTYAIARGGLARSRIASGSRAAPLTKPSGCWSPTK